MFPWEASSLESSRFRGEHRRADSEPLPFVLFTRRRRVGTDGAAPVAARATSLGGSVRSGAARQAPRSSRLLAVFFLETPVTPGALRVARSVQRQQAVCGRRQGLSHWLGLVT